jgi:NADH-quinone oxidoreductase subunit H
MILVSATNLLASDPILSEGYYWGIPLLAVIIKVLVAFVLLLVSVLFMIWFERKFIADMQNRIGPSIAGPWGLLQTLADGLKLNFKEDLIPDSADVKVFKLAPFLTMVPAFLTFAVIPVGGNFVDRDGVVGWFGHVTRLQVADPPIGLLFVLAMSSVAVYGVMLAGWSSGSKYPLLGSVRASAQMISYEAALGLSAATVFLQSKSLETSAIVAEQSTWRWNVAYTGIVPFVIFLIAATAELNRPPFDLVEAEQELVGGFHTEYSSMRFGLFFVAEFMNTVTMSAIIVTLFFGGPNGPLFGPGLLKVFLPTVWFLAKVLVFLALFVSFRGTLPRLRYDQLMDLGWKVLIPIALGWFLLIGARDVGQTRGWNSLATIAVAVAVMVIPALLLSGAIRTAKRARQIEEVSA